MVERFVSGTRERWLRRAVCSLMLIAAPASLHASLVYLGIEPGTSTRDSVSSALGPPVASPSAESTEHKPQEGTGKIIVEYRPANGVVDRIDVHFLQPIERGALIKALELPESGDRRPAGGDVMVEWFDAPHHLALTYAGKEVASGVVIMGYYSRELFECRQALARGGPASGPCGTTTPPTTSGTPPASGGVTPAAATPPPLTGTVPPSVKRDPAACYDIFLWADAEEGAARRAKNVLRRQSAMDIRLAAQSGDCERARTAMAAHKVRFP